MPLLPLAKEMRVNPTLFPVHPIHKGARFRPVVDLNDDALVTVFSTHVTDVPLRMTLIAIVAYSTRTPAPPSSGIGSCVAGLNSSHRRMNCGLFLRRDARLLAEPGEAQSAFWLFALQVTVTTLPASGYYD